MLFRSELKSVLGAAEPLGEGASHIRYEKTRGEEAVSVHQFQLFDQPGSLAVFVDHIKHVTDIDTDAPLQVRFEDEVTAHRFPIPVESQSDQFALSVKHSAAGITAGDIVVGDEADVHVAFRAIPAEGSLFQRLEYGIQDLVIRVLAGPLLFFEYSLRRSLDRKSVV